MGIIWQQDLFINSSQVQQALELGPLWKLFIFSEALLTTVGFLTMQATSWRPIEI